MDRLYKNSVIIEKMLLNELQAIADKAGYTISKIEIEKK